MTVFPDIEILTQLDRCDTETADDLETKRLEFMPWAGPRDCMRMAVEYSVCLANAKGGMADLSRGRAVAIHGTRKSGMGNRE